MKLEKGKPYYRVTYADPEFSIPDIKPRKYIGDNILEEEKNNKDIIHYFQDYSNPEMFYPETSDELGSSIYTLEYVIEEITKAKQRGKN